MRLIVFLLCFLLVQCDSTQKGNNNDRTFDTYDYVSLYNYLKKENYIVESSNGVNYQFSAIDHYSHRKVITLLEKFESFPMVDKSIIQSLKIAGLNLNRNVEKDSFLKAQFFENYERGTTDFVFISNYIKLQPTNPYFLSAFRTITLKADKKFLKKFLLKSGYMKFNRFTDEYTSYDLNRLSHLPKGLVDTLLMRVDL